MADKKIREAAGGRLQNLPVDTSFHVLDPASPSTHYWSELRDLYNSPPPVQTLTDGATINWDASSGAIAQVTLGGDRTMAAPTNLKSGGTYSLIVKQDGTPPRLLTWNAVFKWPGGTAPTLSTGANDIDVLTFIYDGTNLYGVFQGDFS